METCSLFRCRLIDVPDPVPTSRLRTENREKRRPFDCVLITPNRCFCLELKFGYNKQMPHQKVTESIIAEVNPIAYWVVTKRHMTKKTVYIISQNEKEVTRLNRIDSVVKFFTDM